MGIETVDRNLSWAVDNVRVRERDISARERVRRTQTRRYKQ